MDSKFKYPAFCAGKSTAYHDCKVDPITTEFYIYALLLTILIILGTFSNTFMVIDVLLDKLDESVWTPALTHGLLLKLGQCKVSYFFFFFV